MTNDSELVRTSCLLGGTVQSYLRLAGDVFEVVTLSYGINGLNLKDVCNSSSNWAVECNLFT